MSSRRFRNMLIGLCFIILMVGFIAGYFTTAAILGRNSPRIQLAENTSYENENYNVPIQEQGVINNIEETEKLTSEIEASPLPSKKSQKYLVKNHMGNLAVYKISENNEVSLSYVLEFSLELLPQVDREKLNKGIQVNSEEELLELIEDFIS